MSEKEKLINLITQAENSELNLLEFEKKILADYLLKNGVIVSSAKIGDTLCYFGHFFIIEKIELLQDNIIYQCKNLNPDDYLPFTFMAFYESDIGETVFLSREKTEKSLKKRESEREL